MTPGAVRFRLPQILKERGIKQKDLAEKMGVHKQTVSRLAGGVRQIDLETLAKLCEALDLKIEDLLVYIPDEDEGKPS
jgi:putative transcriptional regulator